MCVLFGAFSFYACILAFLASMKFLTVLMLMTMMMMMDDGDGDDDGDDDDDGDADKLMKMMKMMKIDASFCPSIAGHCRFTQVGLMPPCSACSPSRT